MATTALGNFSIGRDERRTPHHVSMRLEIRDEILVSELTPMQAMEIAFALIEAAEEAYQHIKRAAASGH